MKLDNDTYTQLSYNTNFSNRPQDFMGYDITHEDTVIFDEEFDLQESYSFSEPQITEAYAVWFCSFICDELNFFSKQEEFILSSMLDLLNLSLYSGKEFNTHSWHYARKWIQNHTV